jgi:hypothetical protein
MRRQDKEKRSASLIYLEKKLYFKSVCLQVKEKEICARFKDRKLKLQNLR